MQLTKQADMVMKLAEVAAKGESINVYHIMIALDDFVKLSLGKGTDDDVREKLEKAADEAS